MRRAALALTLTSTGACTPIEVEVDLLLEELVCAGAADPMVIETEEQLAAALSKTTPIAHAAAYGAEVLAAASAIQAGQLATGEESCLQLNETTASTTLSAACVGVLDGYTLTGAQALTTPAVGAGQSWSWAALRYAYGDEALFEASGSLAWSGSDAEETIPLDVDLSWRALLDGETDGAFLVQASGDLYRAYTGSLSVFESVRAPAGELCFGMQATYDTTHEGWAWRTLAQGAQLWEIQEGWTTKGEPCQTITADGELFADDCG